MLEIIDTTKKNIFKPNNFHKISFLGVAKRETFNPFGKKYDLKIEEKYYFKAFGGIYTFNQKKEYREGVLVRIKHSDEISEKPQFFKNKEKDDFKRIKTKFFIPKDRSFILDVKDNVFIDGARSKALVYENEYLFFIKNDGWDNEKEYGVAIKSKKLQEMEYNNFKVNINFHGKASL